MGARYGFAAGDGGAAWDGGAVCEGGAVCGAVCGTVWPAGAGAVGAASQVQVRADLA